jgi:single-stranded DNA-binding protein
MNLLLLDGVVNGPIESKTVRETALTTFLLVNHHKGKTNTARCDAWGHEANKAAQLKEGDRICIAGEYDEMQWKDKKTGNPRSMIKVKVNSMSRVTPPVGIVGSSETVSAPAPAPAPVQPEPQTVSGSDDIPF